jgi:hypothetical protein
MRWVYMFRGAVGPQFWDDKVGGWTTDLRLATVYPVEEHFMMVTYERAEAEWAAANI